MYIIAYDMASYELSHCGSWVISYAGAIGPNVAHKRAYVTRE